MPVTSQQHYQQQQQIRAHEGFYGPEAFYLNPNRLLNLSGDYQIPVHFSTALHIVEQAFAYDDAVRVEVNGSRLTLHMEPTAS